MAALGDRICTCRHGADDHSPKSPFRCLIKGCRCKGFTKLLNKIPTQRKNGKHK